jgi:predicted type IV restriction endonuclease
MALDEAFETAKSLCAALEPRLSEIETEQDARFQIINRFLTEVLGWDFESIKTEPHSDSGYTDYLLSALGQKRFVIEAKRHGPLLVDSAAQGMRTYKVGGPALSSAAAGIQQAAKYCLDHGVNYATLTTGVAWISFIPMPGAGISFREGIAFVFNDLSAILNNFATFYDLFSKEAVIEKTYTLQFAKAGGLSITAVEPLVTANRNEYIRLLSANPIATDLEPVFREFFGALSANADREMLIECFVASYSTRY